MTSTGPPKRARGLPGGIFTEELRRMALLHPADRIGALERFIDDCRTAMGAAADMRGEAAADLREAGLRWREIGELLGVTTAQAHNVATGRSGERARKADRQRQLGNELEESAPSTVELRQRAKDAALGAEETLRSLGRLGRMTDTAGGEWDWYRGLSRSEQARLGRRWLVRSPDAMQPDDLADMIARHFGDVEPGDIDGAMHRWLSLTRVADAGRSVAQGRTPVPGRFGGLTGRQLFGQGDGEAEDESWVRDLRPCTEGPSPAEMTYEQWCEECDRCEAITDAEQDQEWGSPEGDVAWRRYGELLPAAVDVTAPRPAIFRQVVAGYRVLALAASG